MEDNCPSASMFVESVWEVLGSGRQLPPLIHTSDVIWEVLPFPIYIYIEWVWVVITSLHPCSKLCLGGNCLSLSVC